MLTSWQLGVAAGHKGPRLLAFGRQPPEGGEVPGFLIEEAFVVGHDVLLTDPLPFAEVVDHPQSRALVAAWEDLGPRPVIRDEVLSPQRLIWLRNHERDEQDPFEAVTCEPLGTKMEIPPFVLNWLEANPGPEAETRRISFQMDTVYDSPPFFAPWGQTVRVRSTVSDGGDINMYRSFY